VETCRNSYLPYCLGNIFKQQRGIQSYGYHNYYGSYYGRDETHPNMGYNMQFLGNGLDITPAWPASDYEMMQDSVGDWISQEQFHAYYMTFSGHMYYDTSSNKMAARNWSQVKDLKMSYANRCYMACNLELEKALAAYSAFDRVHVKGLMAVAPLCEKKSDYLRYFGETSQNFIDFSGKKLHNIDMSVLSMGMSDSLFEAVYCGSTLVRVGSGLFGKRSVPKDGDNN
jgi:hypothetical protein